MQKLGGGSKSLGEMAMLRDACFPEGMPSFLGKMEWGCQKWHRGANIFRDSIFPVTPGETVNSLTKFVRYKTSVAAINRD